MRTKRYSQILKELGWPRIYLIDPPQYVEIDGDIGLKDFRPPELYGIASDRAPVISVHSSLKGKVRDNVLYHEIAHHLFPHRPHWWIEAYAQKMARGGGTGFFCKKYGHSVEDLPDRGALVRISVRASKNFNKKWRKK